MRAAAFRQLLEDGDILGLRRFWCEHAPHLPQPKDADQAEIVMHMARTETISISYAKRVYSHRWLTERNLPSKLPGNMIPTIVDAVGISVGFCSAVLKPAAVEVRGEMANAVEDCYANGDTEVPLVRQRMAEARERTMKALFGR